MIAGDETVGGFIGVTLAAMPLVVHVPLVVHGMVSSAVADADVSGNNGAWSGSWVIHPLSVILALAVAVGVSVSGSTSVGGSGMIDSRAPWSSKLALWR